jgi:hypothetical protein
MWEITTPDEYQAATSNPFASLKKMMDDDT